MSTEQPDSKNPENLNHLSADEVRRLLEFVSKHTPIIVGGQSINIWATLLQGQDPELDALGPLTSKDVDFFHNKEAAKALADGLEDGKIQIPTGDDFTPNAAVVTGRLNGREVVIDFMSAVKGVKDQSLLKHSITFADQENPEISITLMHPLDCIRSRLANINDLKRTSEHALKQAQASLKIFECYLAYELSIDDIESRRRVTRSLQEFEYVITDRHIGRLSHVEFDKSLDLLEILTRYVEDTRLDIRWREKILTRIIARVNRKFDVQKARFEK